MANAIAELNRQGRAFKDGKDSIVIVNSLGDIPGGKTLDVTGFEGTVINAGHVVVKKADGGYAPLAVNSGSYAEVTSGDTVVGVVKATVLKENPQVGILTIGQVKEAALPYPVTEAIKKAIPLIQFI